MFEKITFLVFLFTSTLINAQVDTLLFNHIITGKPGSDVESRTIKKQNVQIITNRDDGTISTIIDNKYEVIVEDLYSTDSFAVNSKEEKDITFTGIKTEIAGTIRQDMCIITYKNKGVELTFFNSDKDLTSVEKKKESLWEHNYYVDDYGDPTNEGFSIISVDDGLFSNSATSNSNAFMKLIKEDVGTYNFRIFEYRWSSPARLSSRSIKVKIKDINGVVHKLKGKVIGRNIIDFKSKYSAVLDEIFTQKGTIKIYFSEGEYTTSTYRYKVEIF